MEKQHLRARCSENRLQMKIGRQEKAHVTPGGGTCSEVGRECTPVCKGTDRRSFQASGAKGCVLERSS